MTQHEFSTQEILDCLVKLKPEEGDVLFIDGRHVDVRKLRELHWPVKVVVVPVFPECGEVTVRECIIKMTKEEFRKLLWELDEE